MQRYSRFASGERITIFFFCFASTRGEGSLISIYFGRELKIHADYGSLEASNWPLSRGPFTHTKTGSFRSRF